MVGDPAQLPGSSPAIWGESLQLYATGLQSLPTSELLVGPVALDGPARVWVGGNEAAIDFAGLVAPGLFQVNITVPQLGPGLHPVEIEVNGARSPPGPALWVSSAP